MAIKLIAWDGQGDLCSDAKCRRPTGSGQAIQISMNESNYRLCSDSWNKLCKQEERNSLVLEPERYKIENRHKKHGCYWKEIAPRTFQCSLSWCRRTYKVVDIRRIPRTQESRNWSASKVITKTAKRFHKLKDKHVRRYFEEWSAIRNRKPSDERFVRFLGLVENRLV